VRAGITKALDLVGPKTAALYLDVCSREQQNGRKVIFVSLAMMSSTREVPANVSLETAEMKRFVLYVDACIYGQKLNQLLERGLLKLPNMYVLEGGLEPGLKMLKKGYM